MKSSEIPKIMRLARKLQSMGISFIPCFVGESGIGKSYNIRKEIDDERSNTPDLKRLDYRAAYMEPPEQGGLPFLKHNDDGTVNMVFALPEDVPVKAGVNAYLILEEINRASSFVMNGFMELCQERSVRGKSISNGVTIVAAINPEDGGYEATEAMDTALKNRFTMYYIEFDLDDLVKHMKANKYNEKLINWVKSPHWQYRPAKDCTESTDVYISGRTFEKLNALLTESEEGLLISEYQLFIDGVYALLGEKYARSFLEYISDNRMVTLEEILEDKDSSLSRITTISKDPMRTDVLAQTVDQVVEGFRDNKVNDELFFDVMTSIYLQDIQNDMLKRGYDIKSGRTKLPSGDKYKLKNWIEDYPQYRAAIKSLVQSSSAVLLNNK